MKLGILALVSSVGALLLAGCAHDQCCSTRKPLEGNPGATTNQASGYDASDKNHYHPVTDDTTQYRPAATGAVQPNAH